MKNVKRRPTGTVVGILMLALVLIAAGCGSSSKKSGTTGGTGGATSKSHITIGATNVSGSRAVAEAYALALAAKGYDITFKDNIGTREQVYPLVKNGTLDLEADFTGSLLTYLGGNPTSDPNSTYTALQQKLAGTGLAATTPAAAQDVNGFYVTKATADKYHLANMSDLTKTDSSGKRIDSQLSFGGPPECQERPLCLGTTSQQKYGLKFKTVRKLDAGGPITSKALKDNTIQVGELFTGSSVIDPDFVLLTDDKGLQPADNPTGIIRQQVGTPDVTSIIDNVNSKLSLAAYNKMSTSIDVDKIDPKDAAKTFLQDAGISS
jgi:osmoprotectant transport system substrate-binding protein